MGKKHKKSNNVHVKALQPQSVSKTAAFKLNLLVFVILAVAVFIIYGNSLKNPFIWDDQYLIQENHFIKGFKYFFDIFKHHLYYSTAGSSNFYRPLQTLFLMLDYGLWKENPIGYHITSIIFHLLCAFFIYILVKLLFKDKFVSFLVSFIFLVHPINSTVVNYISSRADSQVTLFTLIAYWLFFKSIMQENTSQRNKAYYALSLISFILALISKELGIILPFLILVTWPLIYKNVNVQQKPHYKSIIPYFIILGIYAVLRLTVLNFSHNDKVPVASLYSRISTTFESFVRLISLLFVPREIHIEKYIPFSKGFVQPSTLISFIILLLIIAFAYLVRRKSCRFYFGTVWFFISLIPMANILPINATIADHWLYLPCAGFFLAIIGGIDDTINQGLRFKAAAKKIAIFVYIVVAFIFSLITIRQNTIWSDPVKFYQLALKFNPNSFRAHNELGVIYLSQNQYNLAIQEFIQAVRVNPRFDQAYDNLGVAYDKSDNLTEAVTQHIKAIELNPYNPKTYNNLGNAYNRLGQFSDAIKAYERALELNPDYKAVYNNLGVIYYKQGRYKEAQEAWKRALQIDPGFQTAIDNLKALPSSK